MGEYLENYEEELDSEVNLQISKLNEQEKQEKINAQKKKIKTIGITGSVISGCLSILFLILIICFIKDETTVIYPLLCIQFFALFIGFLIYTIVKLKQKDDTLLHDKIVSEVYVKVRNRIINKTEQLAGYPKIENFTITKSIKFKTLTDKNERMFIDNNDKKFIFKFENGYSKQYSFQDLLSYDINENNKNVVKGTAGKSLIGGLFFGLEGMIIGGNMSKKIDDICDNLQLIIRLNDIDTPQVVINYLNNKVNKNSDAYKSMKSNLQEISSNLEYILNNRSVEKQTENNLASKKEQLKELKELLDEGLITQEDFNKKKDQILNI